jgi:putative aminopeptidase FrvX
MVDRLHSHLRELLSLPGLPGDAPPVRRYLEGIWGPMADQTSVSPLGSLHARLTGNRPAPRPCVMVSAHMDSIALAVDDIDGAFLRMIPVGRFDPRLLPGQRVIVHGRRALPGIALRRVTGKASEEAEDEPLRIEDIVADTGLPEQQLRRAVSRGDSITFAQPPVFLGNGRVSGHTLDNRCSLAAITLCLEALRASRPGWDVAFVASAHEETTFSGGRTSATILRPDVAVILDATYGRAPELPEHLTFPLGAGPTNGWGAHVHPAIHDDLRAVAAQAALPLSDEWMHEDSGTEAAEIQLTHRGVPTAVLSIPVLNMHSPVEVADPEDIRVTADLLARYILSLEEPLFDRGRRA